MLDFRISTTTVDYAIKKRVNAQITQRTTMQVGEGAASFPRRRRKGSKGRKNTGGAIRSLSINTIKVQCVLFYLSTESQVVQLFESIPSCGLFYKIQKLLASSIHFNKHQS